MLPTGRAATARTTDPFDALGDPHRREILELLRDGELSVGQIAEGMPISRPAVSRHLRLLKEAGLVKERAVGVRHLYALDGLGAKEVRRYLESVWGEAAGRYRIVAENTAPPKSRTTKR
jgi:DNA-binding transcriptional ArsR family regulator